MIKRYLIILIIIITGFIELTAATFQPMGIGARAMGMGSAFTGLANDASGVFYNPAGLVNVKFYQVQTSYQNMYTDDLLSSWFLGFTAPYAGPGTFALGWSRTGVNDENMLKGFNENVITSSYGFKVIPHFSLGVSFKMMAAFYGRYKGLGYGFDTGALYDYKEKVYLGAIYQNLNKPVIKWDTKLEEKLNSNLRLGFAVVPIPIVTASLDIDQITEERKNLHLGGEVHPFESDLFIFRAGLIMIAKEKPGYTFGGTLNISRLKFTYAFYEHASLGGSSILGLTYEF